MIASSCFQVLVVVAGRGRATAPSTLLLEQLSSPQELRNEFARAEQKLQDLRRTRAAQVAELTRLSEVLSDVKGLV